MSKNEERGAEATPQADSIKRRRPTQEDMVLDYLREHGEITTMDAVIELHIMNPQQRIRNLRNRGYDIRTIWRTSRDGKKYGVYVIRRESA